LTARGNAGAAIFLDDFDRTVFLSVLGDLVGRYNWICHAYCLMGNHYHLLIETPDGNLSEGMRQLNGIYTQKLNRRHGRVGHVFQGRFKSIIVEKDSYLLELCRYVVLNPVRAGIVKHPKDYPWSSFKFTAGRSKGPEFLFTDWVLAQFGKTRQGAQKRYREFVLAGAGGESPWKRLVGQCILGKEPFLEELSPYLKEKAAVTEIPRVQRFAVRPPLDHLLSKLRSRSKRDRAIAKAHVHFGYSQQQIARHVGLHYSTVSRIVQRERKKSTGKT
ncbi:MAG: transposase, partial [Deltaproteobacteria bacterium]|nr:transposase [Deltaproteobacteria bacterium]